MMARKPAPQLPARGRRKQERSRLVAPLAGRTPAGRAAPPLPSIREREARYALILAGANDGLWDWDLRTGKVYWSARIQEILGYDAVAREVPAEEGLERIHAEDLSRYRECFVRYLKGLSDRIACRYRARDATGGYRWVIDHAKGLRDDRNRVYRIAGSVRDITEHVNLESALRGSERRLRDIVEVCPDLLWEVDAELRITSMDGVGRERQHVPDEGILGKTPWEFAGVDPEKDENWAARKAAMQAHRPFRDFRYSFVTRRGEERYYCVAGVPIFDEDGAFAGYRGVTTNETKLRAALNRAQQAEDFLRGALDSISEGFVIYDEEDRIVTCNQAYRDRYPESAARMLPGVRFEDFLRGSLARRQYRSALGREEAWLEERLRRHREASGWVEQQLADGRHILITERRMPNGGTAGLRIDVTALKNAEAALRASEHLLHTTFETINEGVVVIDAELRIAAANRRLFSLLKIEPATLPIGSHAEKLVRFCCSLSESEGALLEHSIREELSRMRQFQPRVEECPLRGETVVEIHDNPLPGGGLVRTYRDITTQKQVEAVLRKAAFHAQEASEAKSEFLASMSHELRTPLNAIIGFSEIMARGLFGPLGDARYNEYAQDIACSGRHLLAIITDILDFAKIESGRERLDENEVDVTALIREAADMLQVLAEKGQVAVTVEGPSHPVRLFVDETKFRQILINLISNAIKFTPAGGRVTIDHDADPSRGVTVKITDTGVGMTAEEIPIALEPFRQLDGRFNRKYPGTGLGLSLTSRLIELHGGALAIDSIPGRGTVVTATFPAKRIANDR